MNLPQKDLIFLETVHRWCQQQIAAFGKRRKYQPRRGFSHEEMVYLQNVIDVDHAVRKLTSVTPVVE